MLGLYIYPIPNGTEYTQSDLVIKEKVIELFGFCGILEGLITKEGWDFLIEFYGYEKLYQMDKEAMWFDEDTMEKYIEIVKNEREAAPLN